MESKTGRPAKNKEDRARRFNTTFRPDILEWLEQMKKAGYSKAKAIDMACRHFKEKFKI